MKKIFGKKILGMIAAVGLAACNSTTNDGSVVSTASGAGSGAFDGIPTIRYTCLNDPTGDLAITPGRGAPALARVEYGGSQWVLSGQPTETGARYSNGQIILLTSPGEATIQQSGRTSKCRQNS
jgi:membrane-bound inhibitor of C-type lysozyme